MCASRAKFYPVLFWLCLFQFTATPGQTLAIRDLGTSGDARHIVLEGKFETGDDSKFINMVLAIEHALIILESPGGMIGPALAIGRAIRLKGFDTIVRDGTSCASACGLVWLAGSSRYLGQSARIGFHAAFVIEDGRALEKGSANAVIGAYLNMLGLPTRAIQYVTTAPPHSFSWLSFDEAKKVGISVERVSTRSAADPLPSAKSDPAKIFPSEVTPDITDRSPVKKEDFTKPLPRSNIVSVREAISAYQRGDHSTALGILRPLAEKGDAYAENGLGLLYFRGHGVPRDYAEALRWFRKAALQAHTQAYTT